MVTTAKQHDLPSSEDEENFRIRHRLRKIP
jgi:hypothetical protein